MFKHCTHSSYKSECTSCWFFLHFFLMVNVSPRLRVCVDFFPSHRVRTTVPSGGGGVVMCSSFACHLCGRTSLCLPSVVGFGSEPEQDTRNKANDINPMAIASMNQTHKYQSACVFLSTIVWTRSAAVFLFRFSRINAFYRISPSYW